MALLRHGDIRTGSRVAARIDYCVFVATVQAMQLAATAARAEGRADGHGGDEPAQAPLTQILLGSRDWQDAVLAQGGSFNPAFARGVELA